MATDLRAEIAALCAEHIAAHGLRCGVAIGHRGNPSLCVVLRRTWTLMHPLEAGRDATARYRERHGDRDAASSARSNAKHGAAAQRRYRAAHPEKVEAYRVVYNARRRARRAHVLTNRTPDLDS